MSGIGVCVNVAAQHHVNSRVVEHHFNQLVSDVVASGFVVASTRDVMCEIKYHTT